jgi:hypothetical protein
MVAFVVFRMALIPVTPTAASAIATSEGQLGQAHGPRTLPEMQRNLKGQSEVGTLPDTGGD